MPPVPAGDEEYTYDERGNMLTLTRIDAFGEVEGVEKYQYDKAGNTVVMVREDGSGNAVAEEHYTYIRFGEADPVQSVASPGDQ